MRLLRLPAHFNRPHYVYRPRQLLRRTREIFHPSHRPTSVLLPWGFALKVNADDELGRHIAPIGVMKLDVEGHEAAVLQGAIWEPTLRPPQEFAGAAFPIGQQGWSWLNEEVPSWG